MDSVADSGIALRLSGATVSPGGKTILDRIDLSIEAGARVALIGPSGAGKTTLLRLFGATLWPERGKVQVLGRDPRRLGGRALRKWRGRIGFLRQQDNLIAPLRVAHNVAMGRLGRVSTLRSLLHLVWPRDLEPVRAALEEVELGDRLWALPEELSGGERQRVALARLVLQQPEVFLADEPVSALDVRLGAQVIDLLLGIATARRATLLVSLHSLDLLDRGFERVVALRDGRVRWDGAPEELDATTLEAIYGAEYKDVEPVLRSAP